MVLCSSIIKAPRYARPLRALALTPTPRRTCLLCRRRASRPRELISAIRTAAELAIALRREGAASATVADTIHEFRRDSKTPNLAHRVPQPFAWRRHRQSTNRALPHSTSCTASSSSTSRRFVRTWRPCETGKACRGSLKKNFAASSDAAVSQRDSRDFIATDVAWTGWCRFRARGGVFVRAAVAGGWPSVPPT